MPATYKVLLSKRAGIHLQEIFNYIEKDSVNNAASMIRKLMDAIDSLELLPYRYPLLENTEIFGTDVRSMPVRPYLIRYHINESAKSVTILSVRHGARQPGL